MIDDICTIEQLHRQVSVASARQKDTVDELQQSYLAHLLARYAGQRQFYIGRYSLTSNLCNFNPRELQTIGDECLLLCGLCSGPIESGDKPTRPAAALGRESYRLLAKHYDDAASSLYKQLEHSYDALISVLQTMVAHTTTPLPSLLDYAEQWCERGDANSYHRLQQQLLPHCFAPLDMRGTASIQ